jgi:glucosamine kinase
MERTTYILAVDGGGTKTAAALLSATGQELATARGGPANLYRNPAVGLAEIAATWRQLCATAGLPADATEPVTVISAGLAGVSGAAQRHAFQTTFAGFAARRLSSDGYTAFLGVFGTGPGAMLSIGTGVVAYRRIADAAPRISSGWGFPVADRGSGAWLGFRLAGEYLDQLDGGAAIATSALWPVAAATIGDEREAILAWLARARAAEFAALAPAIVDAAAAGDALAAALLAEGGAHLLRLACALQPSTEAPLCLGGGLAQIYRPGIEAALRGAVLPADRRPDPLRGAWLIGAGVAPAEFQDID